MSNTCLQLLGLIAAATLACSEPVDELDLSGLDAGTVEQAWGISAAVLDGECSYHLYLDSCDGPEHLNLTCGNSLALTNESGGDAVLKKVTGELSFADDSGPCKSRFTMEGMVHGGGFFYEDLPVTLSHKQAVSLSVGVGDAIENYLDSCSANPYQDPLLLTAKFYVRVGGEERVITQVLDVTTSVWEDYDACLE
jgi:hypothetical protein